MALAAALWDARRAPQLRRREPQGALVRIATAGPPSLAGMRSLTHELAGASLALAAAKTAGAGPMATLAIAAAAVYGSRLPDVDQLGSRVHRRARLERRNLCVGLAGALLRAPLIAVALVARHRGASHSLLACAALAGAAAGGALIGPAPLAVLGGVALGYTAHVLADACTPSGTALWAPFSPRPAWVAPTWARVPTGSLRELPVTAGAAGALVALALL